MKKKSLAQRTLIKRTKKVVTATREPLISAKVTLSDGATVETSSAPIKILIDALGDKGVDWHAKYVEKFNKLTEQCYKELEEITKKAIKEKHNAEDNEG